MATIDMAKLDGTGAIAPRRDAYAQPYLADVTIDIADVVTEKGSAIAASDVIQAVNVPAGTLVLAAGLQVVEAIGGTSTDATVDLGITDVDQWVDGFDLDAASAGDFAAVAAGATTPTMVSAADTIDVTMATQTGTVVTGKVRVFALLQSVADYSRSAGLAALGS